MPLGAGESASLRREDSFHAHAALPSRSSRSPPRAPRRAEGDLAGRLLSRVRKGGRGEPAERLFPSPESEFHPWLGPPAGPIGTCDERPMFPAACSHDPLTRDWHVTCSPHGRSEASNQSLAYTENHDASHGFPDIPKGYHVHVTGTRQGIAPRTPAVIPRHGCCAGSHEIRMDIKYYSLSCISLPGF